MSDRLQTVSDCPVLSDPSRLREAGLDRNRLQQQLAAMERPHTLTNDLREVLDDILQARDDGVPWQTICQALVQAGLRCNDGSEPSADTISRIVRRLRDGRSSTRPAHRRPATTAGPAQTRPDTAGPPAAAAGRDDAPQESAPPAPAQSPAAPGEPEPAAPAPSQGTAAAGGLQRKPFARLRSLGDKRRDIDDEIRRARQARGED